MKKIVIPIFIFLCATSFSQNPIEKKQSEIIGKVSEQGVLQFMDADSNLLQPGDYKLLYDDVPGKFDLFTIVKPGIVNGIMKTIYDNSVSETPIIYGVRQGVGRDWINDTLSCEKVYENSKRISRKYFYPNGQTKSYQEFGKFKKEYFENGTLNSEEINHEGYVEIKRFGEDGTLLYHADKNFIKAYESNGLLISETILGNEGERIKEISYYSGGKIQSIEYYENGKTTKIENFDENGNLTYTYDANDDNGAAPAGL